MLQNTTAYLIARLSIGMSMFAHGLVRMPKLDGFSNWMVTSFKDAALPEALVRPFSYALPVLELAVGVLLLLGLFTRISIITGSIIMLALIFGSGMIEKWDAVFTQIVYGVIFAILYNYLDSNRYSLDRVLQRGGLSR